MILRTTMFPTSNSSLKSTRSIVNAFSSAGYTTRPVQDYSTVGAISTLSGALTAATLKTMLSVSGVGGTMSLLSLRAVDVTARTIRMKITIDGIVAYDATSASTTTANNGATIAGQFSSSTPMTFTPISWRSTFLIEIASSLTETDKLSLQWHYNTEA